MLTDRLWAFDRLLDRPDPPDLPTRGHHLTREGDPRRRELVAKPLAVAWLQFHYLTLDEISVGRTEHRSREFDR